MVQSNVDYEIRYDSEQWISDSDLEALPSSAYWNDRQKERSKCFDVSVFGVEQMELKLEGRGFYAQLNQVLSQLRKSARDIQGVGASLACGTCWLEGKILNQIDTIQQLYCVEMSRHRLFEIAPKVLHYYHVPREKVKLCLGTFYSLKIPDSSLDFVILCQAFHHAYEPERLLLEIARVLKKDGIAIVMGEHYSSTLMRIRKILRYEAKWLLNYQHWRINHPLIPTWESLYPVHQDQGDHHYSRRQYHRYFINANFHYDWVHSKKYKRQGYILFR